LTDTVPPPDVGSGSWELTATREGDRVRVEITAMTQDGEPVTLAMLVSREEARQIAALIEAAAGDAFHRTGQ
jgi:hypothetical protein